MKCCWSKNEGAIYKSEGSINRPIAALAKIQAKVQTTKERETGETTL
jgi:hypothetical protein